MDGRGRWMDNVFIERLWRSLNYEEICLREHAAVPALGLGLARWFERYNTWRPHAALGNLTPAVVYLGSSEATAEKAEETSSPHDRPSPSAPNSGSLRSRLRTP